MKKINNKFCNKFATKSTINFKDFISLQREFLFGKQQRVPRSYLPFKTFNRDLYEDNNNNLCLTWLGHSSVLIKIENRYILTDPIFSKHVSPFPFFSPKRFFNGVPVKINDLPEIDLVIISHDHYDHLDFNTIRSIHNKVNRFCIPVGLSKYLTEWGVPSYKITELNWWEDINVDDKLKIVATPSQHFSGRGLFNRNSTLWSSWVIIGKNHRLFFSGDTGYFSEFKSIGDKFGPFNITMLEIAQYSKYWPDVHMLPEQSVQAHQDLKGHILLPIHWGTFNLSVHEWTEPIERLIREANRFNLNVTTPLVGESFIFSENIIKKYWWK